MAKGSRRSSPTLFSAAAVPSEATLEAMKTPCAQSNASVTSGTALARRPPNRMALIGKPAGLAEAHPADVVADGLGFPARQGGLQHGEVGLAAGAGEGRRQVAHRAFRRGQLQDQHV